MKDNNVHSAWIGLGSNLGDRKKNLERARLFMDGLSVDMPLVSGVYASEPWGFSSSHQFYNQCLVMETMLSPDALLQSLKEIEKGMGRAAHSSEGYADRVIDLDILFIDDLVIEGAKLRIPHPGITERKFVLLPLMEITPEKVHPLYDRTVGELLQVCRDEGEVYRLPPD